MYTEGEGRQKKEKGRDDDKCRGIYLEWSSRDGIATLQILLTSVFTFAVASASIMSPQQAPAPSTTCTLPPPSPPIAFPPLPPFQRFSLLKSAKCDEAGKQAETRELSVEEERGVANGKNCPN